MIEEAAEKLRGILTRMGVDGEVVVRDETERFVLEVRGAETGLIIGKHGATLDALQYLLNKMSSPRGPETEPYKPIIVDAEGYRDRRAESLVELAHRLADKARQTRKPVAAAPMSPADRRVIHMALANEPGLSTRSEGEGAARRLIIIPDPNHDFGAAGDKQADGAGAGSDRPDEV